MYTVDIMAHNTYYFTVYEDIWDLQIDGKSVSGLDFYKQETRSAKYTCKLDDWLRTHIIEAGEADIYKNYLRMLFLIKKDNEILFCGFMKVTNYEIDYITGSIKEITITLYDWLYIIIDQANGLNKSIVQGTEYNPIEEVRTGLMQMCNNMFGLTNGLLSYAVFNNYDNTQWTPYYLSQFVLFDQANYNLSIPSHGQYSMVFSDRYLRIETVNNELILSYVYYIRVVELLNSFEGGASSRLTEKLRYLKFKITGINLIELMNVNDTYTITSSSTINMGVLGVQYGIPEPNDTELITIGGNEYHVNTGRLEFSGNTVFNPIIATATQNVNVVDWIRLCGMINAVYLEQSFCTIRIKNKVSLYNTGFETDIPGEVLEFKQVVNTYSNDEIDVNTDLIVNGEEISKAINTYFQGLIKGGLRNMFEMVMSGCHPEVNLRYQFDGIMLFIMSAEYDIDNDVTKLKALGKRV